MYICVMVGRTIIGGPFSGPGGGMVTYIYTLTPIRDGGDTLVDCFGNGGWRSSGRRRRRAQRLPTGPDWDMRIPEIPKKKIQHKACLAISGNRFQD